MQPRSLYSLRDTLFQVMKRGLQHRAQAKLHYDWAAGSLSCSRQLHRQCRAAPHQCQSTQGVELGASVPSRCATSTSKQKWGWIGWACSAISGYTVRAEVCLQLGTTSTAY